MDNLIQIKNPTDGLIKIGDVLKRLCLTKCYFYKLAKELGIEPVMIKETNLTRYYKLEDLAKLAKHLNLKE